MAGAEICLDSVFSPRKEETQQSFLKSLCLFARIENQIVSE